MTDMIERVIDAMQEAKSVRGATKEDVARAAILAMREPTKAMGEALYAAHARSPYTFAKYEESWCAMIDAALSSPGEA